MNSTSAKDNVGNKNYSQQPVIYELNMGEPYISYNYKVRPHESNVNDKSLSLSFYIYIYIYMYILHSDPFHLSTEDEFLTAEDG